MDDVISLSSSVSDKEDSGSDVEIVSCYSNRMTRDADPLPLSAVRVDVAAINVNVPPRYIDLTDPKWSLPDLTFYKIKDSSPVEVLDLTESKEEDESENLPLDDCRRKDESCNKNQTVIKQANKANYSTSIVKLRRLPFLETHVTELKRPNCSVHLAKDYKQMSLHFRKLGSDSEAPGYIGNSRTSSGPPMGPSPDESSPESQISHKQLENSYDFTNTDLVAEITQHMQTPANSPCSGRRSTFAVSVEDDTCEDQRYDFCLSMLTPSPTSPSSSQDNALGSLQKQQPEQLKIDKADTVPGSLSDHSSLHSLSPGLDLFDPDTLSGTNPLPHELISQVDPTPTCERTLIENISEGKSKKVKTEPMCCSIPSEPALSLFKTEDLKDGPGTGTHGGDLGTDSPVSFSWQEGSDGEQVNAESRFDVDFRAVRTEDRRFVCPVNLRKLMSGSVQAQIYEEDEGLGAPEVLCRQSLSLVYSTIDENYPEGTLQLLSDLLQPCYYPPIDITSHLLRSILLDPKCPHHLCVQAYNLLMKTQRHHMADQTTVPWDWELLTSVMANQETTKRHRCEVLRMFLGYVVQTLEDDFKAKRSTSALHYSITKETLSCDQKFPCVRDIIKWLFSAIMKSTKHGGGGEGARERDEQIRMVSIFQRMLFLALEVDRSPALNSAKLSQELFHMLIDKIPLRAHRLLLLESLQSDLLRCKLLEHLLDYACPNKVSMPMSLSLLLHFLKNCTLAPDPTDGSERWQKWQELVHLIWMLLISHNKAMKGYLCSLVPEQRVGVVTLVHRQDDLVSKLAVHEAVEAFLSRSLTDLGQAIPLHVEESLTYLQDYLLDVCQC